MLYLRLDYYVAIVCVYVRVCCLEYDYHSYDEYTQLLTDYANKYPNKTHLYSIGKSVMGRELWVLAVSDSEPDRHVVLRPDVKYIANMHGNEVIGKELLLLFIDDLLNRQKFDDELDQLMRSTRIHILPSMNPDGNEMSIVNDCMGVYGRNNSNNYDLNRNFPDLFELNEDPIQPETNAIIKWLEANSFMLSANFHGGALVVNYPYDTYTNASRPVENPTSDNDVFQAMALNYTSNNPKFRDAMCYEYFEQGITNGAAWYPVKGGMQDFNYWRFGCMEVLVEISCCKYPPPSEIGEHWAENRQALIDYLKFANTGVRGVVSFKNGHPAVNLTVQISSREPYFKTNQHGEYYRILLPGAYNLTLAYGCEQFYRTRFDVPEHSKLIEMNITLDNDALVKYQQLASKLDRYGVFCQNNENNTKNDRRWTLELNTAQSLKWPSVCIYSLLVLICVSFF